MRHCRGRAFSLMILGLVGYLTPTDLLAQATAPAPPAPRTTVAARTPTQQEMTLHQALRANPLTAPYAFATQVQGRKIVLHGRVGTKQVHDAAIQTAIALGVPVVDSLLIDTAAAHQAASAPFYGPQASGTGMGGIGYTGYAGAGYGYPGAGYSGALPYTYPQPLMGRLDDPFFGFEPPSIAYPPWWGALTARRLGTSSPTQQQQVAPANPVAPSLAAPPNPTPTAPGAPVTPMTTTTTDTSIPDGTIDMTIDGRGVATLRGNVPTLTDRVAIGQQIARTPGVAQVVNLLNVRPMAAPGAVAAGSRPALNDNPPPIPTPADAAALAPAARPSPALDNGPPIVVDAEPLAQRVNRALTARPELAGQPLKVKVRDGVAALSGRVPTLFEAMVAYRAVQQTPGVREVEDRLEFVVPDGSGPNPLADKGRPEDVEPYLEAQIRRQVGDLAHIDRVRIQGDSLEIRGSLARADDRPRFDAILRSLPILRGFRLSADIPVAAP